MRDTLLGITVLVAIVCGYFTFRTLPVSESQSAPLAQVAARDHSAPSAQKAPDIESHKKFVSHKQRQRLTRKATHERSKYSRSNQPQPNENDGNHSRGSGQNAQAEKLPSIYQDEEGRRTEELARGEGPKTVYGVPVDAWVLSQRNSITTEPADARLAEGVRLFVGCMEIKEGHAEALSKRDCAKVASQTRIR